MWQVYQVQGMAGRSKTRPLCTSVRVRSRREAIRVLLLATTFLLAWSPAEALPCLPGYCGYFIVKNACWRSIKVAIYYHAWRKDWTATGFYHLDPGEETLLAKAVSQVLYAEDRFGRPVYTWTKTLRPRRTGTADYYYHAQATDGSGVVWGGRGRKGSKWVTVGGEKLPFRKESDRWNDAYLTLTCAKPQ